MMDEFADQVGRWLIYHEQVGEATRRTRAEERLAALQASSRGEAPDDEDANDQEGDAAIPEQPDRNPSPAGSGEQGRKTTLGQVVEAEGAGVYEADD